jgi:hypothetical protein
LEKVGSTSTTTTTPTTSAKPAATGPALSLKFKTQSVDWQNGKERKTVLPAKKGIAALTGVAGNFGGPADSIELQVAKNGSWTLGGKSQDFISARGTGFSDLQPTLFPLSPQTVRYEWSNGKPPVKMLHRKDGICVLAGWGGALRGYGEGISVRLADDGYWYLDGHSAQGELHAIALGIRWSKPGTTTCSESIFSWKTGDQPVQIGPRTDGLCVLSGISGNMLGGGEGMEIVSEDDQWMLKGSSQQAELRFDASLIRIEKSTEKSTDKSK